MAEDVEGLVESDGRGVGLAADDVNQAGSGVTGTVRKVLHRPGLPPIVGGSSEGGDAAVVTAFEGADMPGVEPDPLLRRLRTATAANCPRGEATPGVWTL
ncbi:hypothetical protein Slala05_84080 [Streptomyces lavendulae subsp. lavendulae]|nr:hypothetical protein Slala05_84080 [Streptomyces lavendulae subsp. lavendulae]